MALGWRSSYGGTCRMIGILYNCNSMNNNHVCIPIKMYIGIACMGECSVA